MGDPLEALLEGRVGSVEFSGGQVICDAARRNRVYLPGSFNPLHDGHRWDPKTGTPCTDSGGAHPTGLQKTG